jgi:hypothetical protein
MAGTRRKADGVRLRLVILALLAPILAGVWGSVAGGLDCVSRIVERAPDGRHTMGVCARPGPLMAMPGQGGDRAGSLVLRTAGGWIVGVTSVEMVREAESMDAVWTADRVRLPLHADMARGDAGAFAPLVDALWRVRTGLGLIPADTDHR